MTGNSDPIDPKAIINANASIFRKGAKISYFSMVHIIAGFAHATPIAETARQAKTHRDTVRDIYADLRDHLSNPRFDIWMQSLATDPYRSDAEDQALIAQAREAMFGCHENTECYKRHQAGRRKTRLCRACPIKAYVEIYEGAPEQAADLVELTDNIRDFYRLMGWKEHNPDNIDPRTIFDTRLRHYEIISTAVSHSTFDKNGKLTSTEDDFLSISHLIKTIWDYLKSESFVAK